MTIPIIAAVIESIANNGKVQSVGKKLDRRDYEQFAYAAAGDVIRKLFYDQRNLDDETTSFLSASVQVRIADVVDGGAGRKIINEKVFQLPRNLGIFGIYPVVMCGSEEEIDSEQAFTRLETGSRWYYTKSRLDDLGILAFTVTKGLPELFCSDEVKRVGIEGVFKDDIDIPEYAAYAIINNILASTLRVAGFPIDMKADGDPNVKVVQDAVRTALTA